MKGLISKLKEEIAWAMIIIAIAILCVLAGIKTGVEINICKRYYPEFPIWACLSSQRFVAPPGEDHARDVR